MRFLHASIGTLLMIGACAAAPLQSSEEEVWAALDAFHAAELAGDVPSIMDAYSDQFSDAQGTSKEIVRGFFQGAVDQGMFADLTIDMAQTNVTVVNGIATVQPITYTSGFGKATYSFRLRKESDGAWRFVGSTQLL